MIAPFLIPVDEERDYAPNYYKIISDPVDLQTIEDTLLEGNYESW